MYTLKALIILVCTVKWTICLQRSVFDKPNIILIMIDDVGYGDFASYGHPTQEFNEVDKMAQEGLRFTQWYATSSLCTPSRAATLTGKLPIQMDMKLPYDVYRGCHPFGLPKTEPNVAKVLKQSGYKTGIIGKWHLGLNEQHYTDGAHLPHNYGFDDVRTIFPGTLNWNCDTNKRHRKYPLRESCVIYHNRTIIQQPTDLQYISVTLLNDARAFIHDNANRPFFLYLSLLQAHTAMFNIPQFVNASRRGVFGDQLNEIAWIVGEVQSLLHKLELAKNTIILLLSDNGPHLALCAEGGNAGPFHGEKWTQFEGGLRVPAIAWWPGVIEAGRVDATVVNNLDVLPTFAELAGASLPQDKLREGKSLTDILINSKHGHTSLHDIQFFYHDVFLMAVRYKRFKIHFHRFPDVNKDALRKACRGNFPVTNLMWHSDNFDNIFKLEQPEMFDVEEDPGESHPLPLDDYAAEMEIVYDKIKEFELSLPSKISRNQLKGYCISSLKPCCNPPYCLCNYPGSIQYQTPRVLS